MPLNSNALLTFEEFTTFYGHDAFTIDIQVIESLINQVSTLFENFCNRILKATTFTYDSQSQNYDVNLLNYCVFDPPPNTIFYFPTYPVNSLTTFSISGTVIPAASSTDYLGETGYVLYNKSGKLLYIYGFDYGYFKNVKAIWNGGYSETSVEMSELKRLCFDMCKSILNQPDNFNIQSETIGQYQYQLISPTLQKTMYGLPPNIYTSLSKYKRIYFA